MKLIKYITLILIIMTTSCDFISTEFDNPVDEESENYQGFQTISDTEQIDISQIVNKNEEIICSFVTGATAYELQISNSNNFSVLAYNNNSNTINSFDISEESFQSDTKYYYRARAFKEEWGGWSGNKSFITLFVPVYDSEISIDTGLINSIEISFTGFHEYIGIGSDMNITAITGEVPDNYSWYIDGVLLPESTGTITIGRNLLLGNYKLFIVISVGSAVFTEELSFTIMEEINIGDTLFGGIVFYLDDSGGGLIAATEDISGTKVWGTYGLTVSGADSNAIGSGAQNTLDIIAGDSSTTNAAHACADYSVDVDGVTYDDWFLPSKDELNQMYVNKTIIGGFTTSYYWSSSESSRYDAWSQSFTNGYQSNYTMLNSFFYVRPVRAL